LQKLIDFKSTVGPQEYCRKKGEGYEETEPVVIVAIWRINREVVHGQIAVSGQAAPMLHVFSSYSQHTC
jgi:hypothetical protein